MSMQKETKPFKIRRDRERDGLAIPNEIIFNAYCDDPKFYDFLKMFTSLTSINDLPQRLRQVKDYLSHIG